MPRRKPASAKHKKQKLQDKRALKRGDLTAEEHAQNLLASNKNYGRVRLLDSKSGGPVVDQKKLQSRFVALSPTYLSRMRDLAFSTLLPRPLPPSSAVFPIELLTERDTDRKLSCPSRPKFRYGQTKKEVEKNEEGHYKKWLKNTEEIMQAWVDEGDNRVKEQEERDVDDSEDVKELEVGGKLENGNDSKVDWPRGPTWFETNLEVWRQLWRVTETSSILLLLLDSRCPPLHCPPSLRTYLQNLNPKKEVILVLTKSDLVDPMAQKGWEEWVKGWWGVQGVQVVSVRSYDVDLLNDGKGKHRPDIPQQSLDELVSALQKAHGRLLAPPAWAASNPEKLKEWTPPVRPAVDWASLAHDESTPNNGPGRSRYPTTTVQPDEHSEEAGPSSPPRHSERTAENLDGPEYTPRDPAKEPLTIGLIGQPNVGKSSLLNALLGEQRVRASRTPGKTKHFQTMFWGDKKEIRVVDCPGLVCPSLVGLEIQALAATIPISQIASLPSCITFAAHHLPLESIFRVPYSVADNDVDPYAGKRTYRDPALAEAERIKREEEAKKEKWTAGKIMEGRALDRGYLTAKSGRPDTNRAANGIMRNLADGRIRWGFFPPPPYSNDIGSTSSISTIDVDADTSALTDKGESPSIDTSAMLKGRGGRGIWLESANEAALNNEGEDGDDASGEEKRAKGGKGANEDIGDDSNTEDEDEEEGEDESKVTGTEGGGSVITAEDYVDFSFSESDDEEDEEEDEADKKQEQGERKEIEEEEDEDNEKEQEEAPQVTKARGFFAALEMSDDESEEEEESDEEDDEAREVEVGKQTRQ